MFYKLYDDAREIGGARIAAIGPATAQRVRDFHLKVDLQPEEFVAEAVVREFKKEGDIENLRILIAGRRRRGTCYQGSSEPWAPSWMWLSPTEPSRRRTTGQKRDRGWRRRARI